MRLKYLIAACLLGASIGPASADFVSTMGIPGIIEVSYFVAGPTMAPSPNDLSYGSAATLVYLDLVFPDGSLDPLPTGGVSISWDANGTPSIIDSPSTTFFYPTGTAGVDYFIATDCALYCAGAATITVAVIPGSITPLPAALPLFAIGLLLFAITRRLRHKP